MGRCERWQRWIESGDEGRLGRPADLADHLRRCPSCRAAYPELRWMTASLASSRRPRASVPLRGLAAAALLIALGLGIRGAWGPREAPAPARGASGAREAIAAAEGPSGVRRIEVVRYSYSVEVETLGRTTGPGPRIVESVRVFGPCLGEFLP